MTKPKQGKQELTEEDIRRIIREEIGNSFRVYPPYFLPPQFPPQPNPNLHYHGQFPCYNNPCYYYS